MVGLPEATLRGWINRGLAFPDREPFGSFAVDYQRAERGLAHAIDETAAMKVQLMREQMARRLAWETREPLPPKPKPPRKPGKSATAEERAEYAALFAVYEGELESWKSLAEAHALPPPSPDVDELMWMQRHKIARFPADYGTSKHRQVEAPFDAQEWLDANAMDREQLAALFSDPPESIRAGLVAAAPAVYAILLAGGFEPAQRKAENDGSSEESEGVRGGGS
jgi:hypothetical protein